MILQVQVSCMMAHVPAKNVCQPKPNRKGLSSNHHFSGAMLNFWGGIYIIYLYDDQFISLHNSISPYFCLFQGDCLLSTMVNHHHLCHATWGRVDVPCLPQSWFSGKWDVSNISFLSCLGGGFKYVFLCSPLFREIIQFDLRIFFQMGGSTTNLIRFLSFRVIFHLACCPSSIKNTGWAP